MKVIADFLPIILFFVAYKTYDIYVATAVAIAASVIQVAWSWITTRRVEKMHLITLGVIVLFGGATLILRDPVFIKWKPTIVNWIFAVAFLGSQFFGRKSFLRHLMDHAVQAPDAVWTRLNYAWITFFLFSGAANLYVAYHYDEDTWVNFKLFGMMGLTFAFIIAQSLYIYRYVQTETESTEESNG